MNNISKSMLETAVDLASRGFYVIPIASNGKKPCISFADKPALDERAIREHWSRHPSDMVALRTVNHFVIDIDRHGTTNGFDSLDKFPPELLANTYAETTPANGLHIYYKKPDNFDLRPLQMINLFAGIDIKAHPNSYTIVAPSRSSKGIYKALNSNLDEMKVAPWPLVDFLQTSHDKQTQRANKPAAGCASPQNCAITWTGQLLEDLATSYGVGSRNDTIARIAGKILRTDASLESVATLLEQVNARFYRIVDGRKVPAPLSEQELSKTFESISRKELARKARDYAH